MPGSSATSSIGARPPWAALGKGAYEPLESRTILDLLRDARLFVDVGANVGWYTVHAARKVPGLRVVAVEPAERTAQALRQNVALNQLSGVTVVMEALGAAPGLWPATVPR